MLLIPRESTLVYRTVILNVRLGACIAITYRRVQRALKAESAHTRKSSIFEETK